MAVLRTPKKERLRAASLAWEQRDKSGLVRVLSAGDTIDAHAPPAMLDDLCRQRAFHDYIFAQVRRTFIHIHSAYWVRLAFLDADEQFGRDYVAIRVVPHLDIGDFVRPDVPRGSVDPPAAILDGDSLPEQKWNVPPFTIRPSLLRRADQWIE